MRVLRVSLGTTVQLWAELLKIVFFVLLGTIALVVHSMPNHVRKALEI